VRQTSGDGCLPRFALTRLTCGLGIGAPTFAVNQCRPEDFEHGSQAALSAAAAQLLVERG
jgi:hypothetical protein